MGLPIIVVPNTQLLNDHQTEMAKHLSKEGYAIMSSGRYVKLVCSEKRTRLTWLQRR
jgi:beta-1,4-N-acetylglucosaminyltransferase